MRTRKLRHVSDCEAGISRRRAGKGFAYRAPDGSLIRESATLTRIRALAIPPAYIAVWICADSRGHLQATGRDARGRKQYRYHPDWRDSRDAKKYRRLLRFGEGLPGLRERLHRDLAHHGLSRDKVLAVMAKVMMATCMRVGSAEYARDNHSFGLTTLRPRHVHFRKDGRALFQFRGKGGKQHEAMLGDRRLVRLVRSCAELPGRSLFKYKDADAVGRIDAKQFNEYLRDAMGRRFSAKDFRTWAGTLTAIRCLAGTPLPETGGERARRAAINDAIEVAAEKLGNTPSVCRKAYICPRALGGWRNGSLHALVPAALRGQRLERRAIRFLKHCLDPSAASQNRKHPLKKRRTP